MLNELRKALASAIAAYDKAGDKLADVRLLDRSIYLLYLDASNVDCILDTSIIKSVEDYDSAPRLRFKAIECLITGEGIDQPITVFMPNPFVASSCSFVSAYGRLYMVWQGALVEALDKLESKHGKLAYNFTVSSMPDLPIVVQHDVYDLISEFTYA